MASVSLFVVFVLSHLVLLHSAEEEGKQEYPYCWPSPCGELGVISYPFTKFPPHFAFALPNSPFITFKCNHAPEFTSHKDEPNLSAEFVLEWHVSDDCSRCHGKGGLCRLDLHGKFYCDSDRKGLDIGITQNVLMHTHIYIHENGYKLLYLFIFYAE
ncbi:hypothetical protein CFP56_022825, partial [Quercus suber]